MRKDIEPSRFSSVRYPDGERRFTNTDRCLADAIDKIEELERRISALTTRIETLENN